MNPDPNDEGWQDEPNIDIGGEPPVVLVPEGVLDALGEGDQERPDRAELPRQARAEAKAKTGQELPAAGPTSYAPIDLAALDADGVEPPSVLYRVDGLALLYARKITWLSGEGETLKGWAAAEAAREVLAAGGIVLHHDNEDHAGTFVERLTALGIDRTIINDPTRVRYLRPAEPLEDGKGRYTPAATDFAEHLRWIEEATRQGVPALAVVDGVTESMMVESLDPNSGPDVAAWLRRIPRKLADAGAAVLCIDHVTKDREGRGHFAIGSVHKLNGVDGAAYNIDGRQPLGRATGSEPVEGLSTIRLAKDRPGWIRGRIGNGQPVADVRVIAYPDGGVTISVEVPGQVGISEHERRIADHLKVYVGASTRALRDLGNSTAIDLAIKTMVAAGWVTIEKVGNAHQHSLTDVGHEHFEASQ